MMEAFRRKLAYMFCKLAQYVAPSGKKYKAASLNMRKASDTFKK